MFIHLVMQISSRILFVRSEMWEKKINSGVGNIKFYKFVDQIISKQNLFEAPKNFTQVRMSKETCLSGLAYYNKAPT